MRFRIGVLRRVASPVLLLGVLVSYATEAGAGPQPWSTHARNAQHSALSGVPTQALTRVRWQTPVDLWPQYTGSYLLIHYGSPLVSAANTVIVPVKTGWGFTVEGRRAADGHLLWSADTDYLLPPHEWVPSFSPAINRARLWIPAGGGTVYVRGGINRARAARLRRIAFYGRRAYAADPDAYHAHVFINTPLTTTDRGVVFFGFQVTGPTPAGLQGGIARIAGSGGKWVAAAAAAGDPTVTKVAHSSAPAVSADRTIVYAALKGSTPGGGGYLVALDSRSLATIAAVRLKDPLTGQDASVHDNGSASPTIGPDGDVYFGVLENQFGTNHARGWLLHFDRLLNPKGSPGAFGWDTTPSIVPAAMVPSYAGPSTYLLATKYNHYVGGGGDGVNRIAILDPNATMLDPVSGISVMQEVLTIAAPTPDPQFPSYPNAVREWCINTAAVDPFTTSVLANNEDGTLYRWDLTSGTLSESIELTIGVGQAYTPTLVGPDGTVYSINNATLFAVGE